MHQNHLCSGQSKNLRPDHARTDDAVRGFSLFAGTNAGVRALALVWKAQSMAGVYAEASAIVFTLGQSRGLTAIAKIAGGLVLLRM